jgi:hypothetical protein
VVHAPTGTPWMRASARASRSNASRLRSRTNGESFARRNSARTLRYGRP